MMIIALGKEVGEINDPHGLLQSWMQGSPAGQRFIVLAQSVDENLS